MRYFHPDVRLEVETDKGWQAVPVKNGGFEAADLSGWHTGSSSYHYASVSDASTEGKRALRITSGHKTTLRGPLFAERPKPGEVLIKQLGSGVSARIPVSLYSVAGHTLGKPRGSLAALKKQLNAIELARLTGADERVRIAGVTIAWNVFQHFYPYFDVVKDKLAEIVGSPTAGANGNVSPFSVPGGITISWTGMRVLKHDGRQHHTIGVTPHQTHPTHHRRPPRRPRRAPSPSPSPKTHPQIGDGPKKQRFVHKRLSFFVHKRLFCRSAVSTILNQTMTH